MLCRISKSGSATLRSYFGNGYGNETVFFYFSSQTNWYSTEARWLSNNNDSFAAPLQFLHLDCSVWLSTEVRVTALK
jgi:hypothetical protein